jgi:hypothetical protein
MNEEIKKAIKAIAMAGIVLILFSVVAVADVKLDVPMYNQEDETWSDDQLGDCENTTIGSAGCAISSIAMVFKYYGVDTDPQNMNNWSRDNKYYSDGCNIQWKNADERSIDTLKWIGTFSTDLDQIKSELDNGYPVIAEVRMSLISGGKTQHFVVITGYSESETGLEFYINDPVGGLEITIPSTRYPGNPKNEIKSIRLYHGSLIQIADQSISPTITKPGDELTFVYNINNPYTNKSPKIRLGAQIRTNNPQGEWIDDVSNDKVVELAFGANDYSRIFKLSSDLEPGFYDARWVIINELTKKPINSKEMIRIFEVQDEPTPTKPELDLIILIDTTGSMGGEINQVKASANEIVEALDATGFDYRVAVADYRDYPVYPYGGSSDYVYNLNLPFSNDKSAIISSINALDLGWGADWRESVYSALVEAMTDVNKDTDNADNYGWRNGVHKAIIIMGDAPPHDPEPWDGGYSLDNVEYWSENIDPVEVYSIVVGNYGNTYAAFSEISEKTGGKAYLSLNAFGVADAIIEAIGDIGTGGYGVDVNITPTKNETTPGNSVMYSVNITNRVNISDVYDVSFEAKNIASSYSGYPTAIQYSWIMFDDSEIKLDPNMSEAKPLVINVPENWAGMEDVIYNFNVVVISTTNTSIGNTSSAELKVKAGRRSMIEYSKLEIQWLSESVNGSGVDQGVKNALLFKLSNAESKLDQAIVNLDKGKMKTADNMLGVSQNIMNAFVNQVNAQYDKKIMQPDAEAIGEIASQIMGDIEKAKAGSL